MNTEGVDDRERAVMGSFKDQATTLHVREVIMKHLADFVAYLTKQMENEKTVPLTDGVKHQVCPQSVMMISELFHHFFDYCNEQLFSEALDKVRSIQ